MGLGGDILKAGAKEATRDITKECDAALIERGEESKRNEAALAANKSAKDRGLTVEEAEEEMARVWISISFWEQTIACCRSRI